MKNPLVDGYEAEDIGKQVAKILKDLGNPEPPLRLEDVRELLKIDREYYTTTEDSILREGKHRVRMAGRWLTKTFTYLYQIVKKAGLSALWLPEKRLVLIDKTTPKLKHRWYEAHEITHGITPWHQKFLLGDSKQELSPACHEQIESEANFGAGQLLFMQERFVEEAMALPPTMESIKLLKTAFGNTWTSTLWRFVEEYRGPEPLVGIVSVHPIRLHKDFDPSNPCRYVIQSPAFRERFSAVTESTLFSILQSYCGRQRGGPLGSSDVLLTDDNADRHVFQFETSSNTYEALTLGIHKNRVPVSSALPQELVTV